MPRIVLKRAAKYFDTINYNLIIYYHKALSIKDIYNKVIKREAKLSESLPEEQDDTAALSLVTEEAYSYLIINSKTTLSQLHHEAIHITTAAFNFIGSRHTEETDELCAYHSHCIFDFILTTLLTKFKIPPRNLLSL